jgi:hypothetical protein
MTSLPLRASTVKGFLWSTIPAPQAVALKSLPEIRDLSSARGLEETDVVCA